MSKKVKSIIIGACVLVALVGVMIVLMLTQKPVEDPNLLNSELEKNLITIIDEEQKSLEYLKIKNAKDEYTIDLQGENKWGIAEIMDYEQDYYIYTETIPMVSKVNATALIEEDASDLSKYGLHNPVLSFEAKFKDKPAYKISLGSLTSDKSSYYFCETGKNTVYTTSSSSFKNLFYSRYDYVKKNMIPAIDAEEGVIPTIISVKVTRPDLEKPIEFAQIPVEELGANASQQSYLRLISPVKSLLSETPIQDYIFNNFGLTATEVVKAKPTEQDKKDYGFDTPTSIFEMKYNDTANVRIVTGKGIECTHEKDEKLDGHKHQIVSYYAMMDSSDQVYVVPAESMRWMKMQAKDVVSSIAVLPNIADIKSIDVTLEGKTHNIEYIKGDSEKPTEVTQTKLDGKDIEVAQAKAYLRLLYGTAIQDINTKEITSPPTASIKYNYEKGGSDLIDMYVLEDLTCVVAVNGQKDFIGRAPFVDKLIKEMKNLSEGKAVDENW